MNELNQVLRESGGVLANDFVIAVRRAVCRVGDDAVLDEETTKVVAEELYQMSIESPEWEVFV